LLLSLPWISRQRCYHLAQQSGLPRPRQDYNPIHPHVPTLLVHRHQVRFASLIFLRHSNQTTSGISIPTQNNASLPWRLSQNSIHGGPCYSAASTVNFLYSWIIHVLNYVLDAIWQLLYWKVRLLLSNHYLPYLLSLSSSFSLTVELRSSPDNAPPR
jgi:hypothetical protein